MKMIDGTPRRARLDLNTDEEKAISDLIHKIEDLGADPLLTDAVVKLAEAKEKLSDWVESNE